MSANLYIVSTPIGNHEDLTLRALRVLKQVRVAAAEDPRRTKELFDHHGIETPLTSYQNLNKEEKTPVLLHLLQGGDDIALVCDAGTPLVSDPGTYLVACAIQRDVRVVPVPGPSAILTALSVSGMPGNAFVFHGSLPRSGRKRRLTLRALQVDPRTHILFELPKRLSATLKELEAVLKKRSVMLACNLTREDERVLHGTATQLRRRIGLLGEADQVTLVTRGGHSLMRTSRSKNRRKLRRRSASVSSPGKSRRRAAG